MKSIPPYIPKNKVRIVTAASLFDGHDAAINIMRRIIQATGVEVIHLGHDRSVDEVVNTSIPEDANANEVCACASDCQSKKGYDIGGKAHLCQRAGNRLLKVGGEDSPGIGPVHTFLTFLLLSRVMRFLLTSE